MTNIKINMPLGHKIKIKIKSTHKIKINVTEKATRREPETAAIVSEIEEFKDKNNTQYDVNQGFMLAQNFYLPNSNIPSINPAGWYLSEKFDGVRAIWNGMDFFTRNLTKIEIPQWFKNKMPNDMALDGEFFIKRNYFNQTSGIIRKKYPNDAEWKPMKFMVFDIPGSQLDFETRMNILNKKINELGEPLFFVQQTKLIDLQDLQNRHKRLVQNGAEGSIIRRSGSIYVPSRSDSLLKVKDQAEEDAYILNWDQGKGRNTGKLGALWVRWANPEDIQKKYNLVIIPTADFRVGTGFTDIDRCPIGQASVVYPKNTIIKIGFFGLQDSGKPRHPAFKGIREP